MRRAQLTGLRIPVLIAYLILAGTPGAAPGQETASAGEGAAGSGYEAAGESPAEAAGAVYSMERCVDMALERSYSIGEAALDLRRARLSKLSSAAGFLPTATGSLSGSSITNSGPVYYDGFSFGSGKYTSEIYSAYMNLTLPLFTGGATLAGYRSAANAVRIAEVNLDETKRAVTLETRLKYYTAVLARSRRDLQKENLATGKLMLDKVEKRFELGLVPRTDVLRMQVERAGYEETLLLAETNYRIALYELLHLLDLPLDQSFNVAMEFPANENAHNLAGEELPGDRGDLVISGLGVSTARYGVTAARAGFLPGLSFSCYYSLQDDSPELIEQYRNDAYRWGTSLNMSIPLFRGFSTYHNYRVAVSELKSVERTNEELLRTSLKELKTARLELLSSRERYKLSESRVELAMEEVRFAEESYNEGLLTLIEVIQARTGLETARVGRLEVLYALRNAESQVAFYLGR